MRPEDLPLRHRLLIAAYRWRVPAPLPASRLARPVHQARVALVTTAGLVPPGAVPFDTSLRGGDPSFRIIAADTPIGRLEEHHRSDAFDHEPMARDRNVAFPLDRLHDLASAGAIGAVAPRHLSFMGSITAPGRLRDETAPAAAGLLADDAVDIALLAPV
ncbi:MAG: glycine/sarcosine/betaine reductase selenoprotein B family protein [Vicinamibacterales bacterium]